MRAIGSIRVAGAALLLGTAGAAATPAAAARPVYREIGDWLLACDNVRDCVARQAPEPGRAPPPGTADGDPDTGIEIVRRAGPGGAPIVRIASGDPIGDGAVRLPAGRGPLLPLRWRHGADGRDASLSGSDARRFVAAIVAAPTLRIGATAVSLRGLAAVLLAMDAAQGRVGTVTALMRPGPRSAAAVPAAAAVPRVRVAPPAPALANPKALAAAVRRRSARLLAAHQCDMPAGVADAAYALGRAEALVVLGCGRFAYQSSVIALRTPRDRPAAATPLRLPDPRRAVGLATSADAGSEYVEGGYDPATHVFSEFSKGRGLADCGSATEWTFDGAAFILSAFRWQDRCAGRAGDWPVLYRTRR